MNPAIRISDYRQTTPSTSCPAAAAVESAFEGLIKEIATSHPETMFLCDPLQRLKVPAKEWVLACKRSGISDGTLLSWLIGFSNQLARPYIDAVSERTGEPGVFHTVREPQQ